MRNQLENIERAEQYVNNKLSTVEKAQFENELKTNPELVKLTEDLENFQSAVVRNEIRNKVERHSKGGNGLRNSIVISSIVIALIGLGALFVNQSDNTFSNGSVTVTDSIKETIIKEEVHLLGGHELWTEPDIQAFEFDSKAGATIEGKEGTLVIVPDNGFVDSLGNVVNGKVVFNLVEALDVEQMVLYKLHTVSNGSPLESGGMFYVDATIDGKKVGVNPKRPLYIEIPTTNKKVGMMAFEGEVTPEGKLNWVDPKPLKKFLVKMPLKDLDFLPEGFEDEVKANMPFLNYKKTTKRVTDSLYYSLNNRNYSATEEDVIMAVAKTKLLQKKSEIVNGVATVRTFPKGERRIIPIKSKNNAINCGIEPTTIETIKTSKFANSFIATKEFEERIKSLHKADNGNKLVNIYIANLGKDMYLSDLKIAKATQGRLKKEFNKFAAEKLTNIKDANIYQERLSAYYKKKHAELKKGHEKLTAKLSNKSTKELNAVIASINTKRTKRTTIVSPIVASIENPNVVTTQVYATQWVTMGWGNMDRYLSIEGRYANLMGQGSFEKELTVSNLSDNSTTEVTLWLGAVNTYIEINKVNGTYTPRFPKSDKYSYAQSHAFAIALEDDKYTWGMKHFYFYKKGQMQLDPIQLKMETSSIEKIKADLKDVNMSYGRVQKRFEWKQKQAEQLVKRQIEARERQAEIQKRIRLRNRYNQVINDLKKVAFPCFVKKDAISESQFAH